MTNEKLTPSQFYKMRRPENFSDSEITYENEMPREQLAYELSQISKNQKHDCFETFCRRLVEKLITPNLIPQVGPTGGGDGKTDFETYPVSAYISDRWFVPENGWNEKEKWAFAISAKHQWKPKAKSDIKKIINSQRDYTRVYFMTNQTPSSKKKKETQDEFITEFGVDVIILDGEWILEKVYSSDLIDLAVNSLNLSDIYKKKNTILGPNDSYRIKKLNEIEEKINKPNRYFEFDFQLVEDALEAAILSRNLEKPRDEVEGKFDRALRFCKKLNNNRQRIRIHYQRAWTYLTFYDDYSNFISEFREFKTFFLKEPNISEIELYITLITLVITISEMENSNVNNLEIEISKETDDLFEVLETFENCEFMPCSSLIAKTHKSILQLMDTISNRKNPNTYIADLSKYLSDSIGHLDYPFETIRKKIEIIGIRLPDSDEFDNLIETIASISGLRSSEIDAGTTFLKRGLQKLSKGFYKESVVYLGKAVIKLAKEETQEKMFFTLSALGEAYRSFGLIWASNNCLISATSISIRSWIEKGILDRRLLDCVHDLAINELLIGRIPVFLTWHEMFLVFSRQIDVSNNSDEVPPPDLLDAFCSIRMLNTKREMDKYVSITPDILARQELLLSQNAALYWLGYTNSIISDYNEIGIQNELALDNYFEKLANQPFKNQMMYETNFLSEDEIKFESKILGSRFIVYFKKDKALFFFAETLLAFFESFLATSLVQILPISESITIEIVKDTEVEYIDFNNKETSYEYIIKIQKFDFSSKHKNFFWDHMMKFSIDLLTKNFFIKNAENHFKTLFEIEAVNERISIVFNHKNFFLKIFGENPKIFFSDWFKEKNLSKFPLKREVPFTLKSDGKKRIINTNNNKLDHPDDSHDKQKVISIIDSYLWDQALWKGIVIIHHPEDLFISLAFENVDIGKQIFENWIKRFGKEDKKENIKISIIKGVDKYNPYHYRVHISSNISPDSFKSETHIITSSRFHQMNPINPINLENLVYFYKAYKQYNFCPSKINKKGDVEPFVNLSIFKRDLYIRDAWEIGVNDWDNVAILAGDTPIIPDHIKNPPVLEVLKKRKKL